MIPKNFEKYSTVWKTAFICHFAYFRTANVCRNDMARTKSMNTSIVAFTGTNTLLTCATLFYLYCPKKMFYWLLLFLFLDRIRVLTLIWIRVQTDFYLAFEHCKGGNFQFFGYSESNLQATNNLLLLHSVSEKCCKYRTRRIFECMSPEPSAINTQV